MVISSPRVKESDDLWKIEVRDNVETQVESHVAYANEPVVLPVSEEKVVQSTDTLARTRGTIKQIREDFDRQLAAKPSLVLCAYTFEAILRDLEKASGIR